MTQQLSLKIQVGELLKAKKLTLALAESCTGGLVGHFITEVSGSSEYFMGGIVAYSYEAKMQVLGVPQDILLKYGAVSEPVALAMARGARQLLKTSLAVSVTGIAGPGGGLPDKPVGLTCIALVDDNGEIVQTHIWQGNRTENKHSSASAALQLIIDRLIST